MKKLLLLLVPIIASATVCYSLDKKYFKSNLKENFDILVEMPTKFGKENFNVIVSFDTPKFIEYAGDNFFDCYKKGDIITCDSDDDGGHMKIKFVNNKPYFNIKYARLAATTDEPIIYYTKAKNKQFIKGKTSECIKDFYTVFQTKKRDQELQKALNSLKNMQNIVINDISHYKDFYIAVGLDASIKTRKKQHQDEFFKSISLYSTNGAKSWQKMSFENLPLNRVIATSKNSAIACGSIEGSGGYISTTNNNGKSWDIVYKGSFINDIAKSNSGFFAVGSNILYSKDTKKWTVVKKSDKELYAVKAIDNNLTIAAGDGIILLSNNNKVWQSGLKKYIYLETDNKDIFKKVSTKDYLSSVFLNKIYTKDNTIYIEATHPEKFKMYSKDRGKNWIIVKYKY